MNFSTDELAQAIEKANEIADHYRLNHLDSDNCERYVDHLRASCQQYLSKVIHLEKLDVAEDSAVRAMCLLMADDSATVCYSEHLDNPWTRFAVCKEIFHLVLDAEEFRNMDLDAHIQEVTSAFLYDDSTPSPPVRAEVLAEVAAMEFLFPFSARTKELAGSDANNKIAIAERYGLPAVLVDRYMSKQYMDVLGGISRLGPK